MSRIKNDGWQDSEARSAISIAKRRRQPQPVPSPLAIPPLADPPALEGLLCLVKFRLSIACGGRWLSSALKKRIDGALKRRKRKKMAILPFGERMPPPPQTGVEERKKSGVSLYGASACVRPRFTDPDFTSSIYGVADKWIIITIIDS